jgi:hypothetical protein
MRSRFSLMKFAALLGLVATLLIASCAPQATNTNTGNSNSANANSAQAGHQGATPADATPAPWPGFMMAGPTGQVSLKFTAPQDNRALSGNTVAPTFNITGYPIYMDSGRNKGQHIHVILDNEPYEADYDPNTPFSPANGKFNNLAPGTHTLRAFPSREWHESIKQPTAFDFVVFNVGQPTATDINKSAPLLTYSRPKGDYKWEDHPNGVMLDFYLTNATLGPNDHKVRYTLSKDGNTVKTETLTDWQPVWWPWTALEEGEYKVVLELLDKDNKPVPFKAGTLDYNHTERTFKIGPKAAPAGGAPTANSNAGGNSNSR